MNKKILLLAGILALGATSFAAEGTRDFLDTFKDVIAPKENITGYWNQEFTGYSDTEATDDKKMRLQNEIGLNLTDKVSVALRTRTYMDYPGKEQKGSDNFRFDMSYNNGNIADTELGLSQRVRMYREGSKAEAYSYRPNISFASYVGATSADANLEFFHVRNTGTDDVQKIAYDIDVTWNLGHGFSTEADFSGAVTTTSGVATESALDLTLLYDHNLYTSTDEATTLAFHAEAGVIPIKYNHKDNEMHSSKAMVIETETYMKLKRNWTNNFNTYGTVGVTTSDDVRTHTSNFGTQGYVALGLSYAM